MLVAAHVSNPARSEPLNRPTDGARPVTIDSVAAAQLLIGLANWPQAILLLETSIASDSGNHELWFLLGMARRGNGEERLAAEAFRQAIALRPILPRPHLELGKSLAEIKDFDGARQAFNEGLALADDRIVRRNIRKFLKTIDQNREISFWIAARMQPDSNPTASSDRKVVTIGGVPFARNVQSGNKNAIGVGVVTGMRYAPWITDTTRMVAEVNYSGLHFLRGCCSDDIASLATGPAFKFGDIEISPKAYYRYRLYDGKAYSSEAGVSLETGYSQPFYSLGLGVEAGKTRLIGIQVAGTAARGYLSADISGTSSIAFGTTVRYERNNYPLPSQAFSAPSVEFRSSFLGLWDLPTNTWVAALYRNYGGPTLTSSGVRIDRYLSLGASVELDFINIWGMSPSVGLAYATQASNDQLGQFNRVRFLFGVGKVF